MTFSLAIQHGDIGLEGNSFATVEGEQKLTQDLSCALLTPIGSNTNYPTYGSGLDGGIGPNGEMSSVFGETDASYVATRVRSELNRICSNYQEAQIARSERDSAVYGKTTISQGEMLIEVENIQIQQAQDNILASVTLKVGSGTIQIHIPIGEK